jgi:hypothetical protein
MKRSIWRHGFFTSVALVALTTAVTLPASVAGAASSRPSAPRSVRARARTASAHVSWAAPASSGSSLIKRYVVTSHPTRRTCTTPSKSCVVKGLKAGSVYTFTVVAKNSAGASPRSRSSNRVSIAVSIAGARANYLAANATLGTSLTADLAAIDAWTASTPVATETTDLTNLQDTFATYIRTLKKDEWPLAARADMSAYIAEASALGADYVAIYGATSASNAALLFDALQGGTNKVAQGDYKVRADLKMGQLITGPVASTSTPVAIGASQVVHDFYGDTLTTTVSQIVDPATAGSDSGLPDAGYRFVAVEATFSNATSGEVEGDTNLGMTVTGSDGQTYTADYGTVAQCTNYTYGEIDVPAGDSASGCVVFQLPTSVTVQSVQFSLDAGYLDAVVWNS